MMVGALEWVDGKLIIIDQTLLPTEHVRKRLDTAAEVWQAIKTLQVRGAPAIGVCAAFGVVVGAREKKPATVPDAIAAVHDVADYLASARPTAVNLFFALDRMRSVADRLEQAATADVVLAALEAEAVAQFQEDQATCLAIGDFGAELIKDGAGILTHCNAGSLATAGCGTALAPMFRAHEQGRQFQVFADETRPLLQGARLTAWELHQAQIPVTLICDNMSAQVMREGRVQLAIVGADRIAANGDTANKIGTYGVAVLAKAHGVPFYVAAPMSTFDLQTPGGAAIEIEQRDPREVSNGFGKQTAPDGVAIYNPAFDVTPAELIAGFITDKGILRPPYVQAIAAAKERV